MAKKQTSLLVGDISKGTTPTVTIVDSRGQMASFEAPSIQEAKKAGNKFKRRGFQVLVGLASLMLCVMLTACGQQSSDNSARDLAGSKIPTDIYGDSFHFATFETSLNGIDCTYASTVDGDNVSGNIVLVHGQPSIQACPNETYAYTNSDAGFIVCDNSHCEVH